MQKKLTRTQLRQLLLKEINELNEVEVVELVPQDNVIYIHIDKLAAIHERMEGILSGTSNNPVFENAPAKYFEKEIKNLEMTLGAIKKAYARVAPMLAKK